MDFEDLHTFSVVARLKSFSRAAENLRVAQSALSRRVQRLEYQFGMPLLERHSRGVRATEAGMFLLTKIEWLEGEVDKIQQDMIALKNSLVGELRLALPHGVIQFLAVKIIELYRDRCPGMKLRIVEGKSSSNQDAVLDGTVDAAMVYDPVCGTEITMLPILFERRLIVGPAEPSAAFAWLKDLQNFPAAKLSMLPLILPSSPHHIRQAVEAAADKCGITLNIALEIDGLSALRTMVKNGLGYTVLPYGPVHQDIEAHTLTGLPIIDPVLECMVGILYRTSRQDSRALIELTKVIREVVQSLRQNPYWRSI
ncbi:MAG TPA: LysR family transcriptional regulator [Acidocella sp.]|nr:LysR family transcriptional regulator [Acidocella sp.]